MAQRKLQDLVDQVDPMWPIIQEWLAVARHPVEVLPAERGLAEAALLTLNVTTRAPLGAMVYETSGMLVDTGWLRLLASASERMRDSVLTWNGLGERPVANPLTDAFVVAHDVVGGFFATNLGAFGDGPRSVFYFAPDTLRWTDMEMSYADFLRWAITGDLGRFYADLRWPRWDQDVAALDGDHGMCFSPMLWSSGPSLTYRSRRAVPQRELWSLHRDLARQLANLPPGTQVRLRLTDENTDKAR
jgi:hypothetical protein